MEILKQNQKLFDRYFCFLQELLQKNNIGNDSSHLSEQSDFFDIQSYKALLRFTPGIIMLIDYFRHNYMVKKSVDLCMPLLPNREKPITIYINQNKTCKQITCQAGITLLTISKHWHCIAGKAHSANSTVLINSLIELMYTIDIHHTEKNNHPDFVVSMKNPDYSETVITGQTINSFKKQFTTREQQIINLLATGKTSKQIAHELHISVHTVNNHRKNMMVKVNAANNAELISKAFGEFAVDRLLFPVSASKTRTS